MRKCTGIGGIVALALVFAAGTAGAAWINVNMYASNGGNTNPQDQNLLVGPAGGAGETWNQYNTTTGSGLLDSAGAATGVGFSNNVGSGWAWGSPDLELILAGRAQFGKGADFTHTINGLDPAKLYNVWLTSYAHNSTLGERAGGEWSTTNPTTTVGPQLIDCSTGLNGTTWEYGRNYVLFENVQPNGSGEIAFLSDAYDGLDGIPNGTDGDLRLPLNGYQIEVIPEPASLGLFGVAVAGLLGVRRRRRSRHAPGQRAPATSGRSEGRARRSTRGLRLA